jgi:hypothetical protein
MHFFILVLSVERQRTLAPARLSILQTAARGKTAEECKAAPQGLTARISAALALGGRQPGKPDSIEFGAPVWYNYPTGDIQ